MDYQQVIALKKGERVQVFQFGQWREGIVRGTSSGADPSMWIQLKGEEKETRVFTGLQFKEDYWNQQLKDRKFRKSLIS